MAAANLLVRSGTSFSAAPFATGTAFSLVGAFSIAGAFSFDEAFSLEDFAVVVDFSGGAFAVPEDFSAVAFATAGDFSVVVDFGFVATFPFAAELALVGAGVFADVVAFVEAFSVRDFPVETDVAAESLAAVAAVSGRAPRAHALAMTTIAISGIRARPVISSLVEGYTEKGDVPVRPILRLERTAATTCPLDSSAQHGVYRLGSLVRRRPKKAVRGLERRKDGTAKRITIGDTAPDELHRLPIPPRHHTHHDDIRVERANRLHTNQLEDILVSREFRECFHRRFHREPEVGKRTRDTFSATYIFFGAFPLQRDCGGAQSRRQLTEVEPRKPESIRMTQGEGVRAVAFRGVAAGRRGRGHSGDRGETELAVAIRPERGSGNDCYCECGRSHLKWHTW
jgi:hypothetical protein